MLILYEKASPAPEIICSSRSHSDRLLLQQEDEQAGPDHRLMQTRLITRLYLRALKEGGTMEFSHKGKTVYRENKFKGMYIL
jgi:hypothetical protein